MLRIVIATALPILAFCNVQCFVGQKLFAYEASNAICARFIPYHCTTQCEWRKNCTQHTGYGAFRGRRTFVSGLVLNTKSTMVLCCTSLSTRIETDRLGRDKCVWRDTESLPVIGPSIRTNPVLAPNHYIRDVRMERDGDSRIDVAIEVCQYQTEVEHCNVNNMSEAEKRRFTLVQLKLQRFNSSSVVQKRGDDDHGKSTQNDICQVTVSTRCGTDLKAQIQGCCKDQSSCDRNCLKNVETVLHTESSTHTKGCTSQETTSLLDCLGRKVNTLLS